MNIGDNFIHKGIIYTVTEVSGDIVKGIGVDVTAEPGPKALPKIIKININSIEE